jgi:membrane protein DedA with SNARE-associated domain
MPNPSRPTLGPRLVVRNSPIRMRPKPKGSWIRFQAESSIAASHARPLEPNGEFDPGYQVSYAGSTSMTQQLISLVSSWGYLAILVTMAGESAGLPISSEIVVPLGGALASQGKLNFILVVAVSSVANLTGSLIAFYLTRRFGEKVILSRAGRWMGLSKGHLRLANRFFDRWGVWAVFLGRLLPIVRTYISFPAGLSKIGYVKFIVVTLLGAIPWNFGLAYAGYLLGQNYQKVATYLAPVAIPAAIVVVLILAAAWWFGRRLGEEDSAKPENAVPGRA